MGKCKGRVDTLAAFLEPVPFSKSDNSAIWNSKAKLAKKLRISLSTEGTKPTDNAEFYVDLLGTSQGSQKLVEQVKSIVTRYR